jgi:hypothetical protein
MSERKPLTEAQLKTLATATLMAQRRLGFTIDAERVADRMVCDSLVKSGHLTAVEGVDGGYRLSDEMGAAIAIDTARQSGQANLN